MELDTIYRNPTQEKFLKIVENLKIKGYKLIRTRGNFFIWQKGNTNNYVRLVLIRTGWHENTLFYWNLELSFKPFCYKHNHRENANIQSQYFNAKAEDLFYNYFLNKIDEIKNYMRHR